MILLLAGIPAGAQTNTGEIAGVVRDSQGGVLPGAIVLAEHLATGTRVERTSDNQGRYFLPSLPIGSYVVTTQLPGFRRVSRSGVVVLLGQTLVIDFALDVGGLAEEIRVTADLPLLQTSNAEISDVIENDVVMQLPLNGRNFLALAQLSDAVVMPPGGTRGEALQQAGPLPNVGGQRSGHNIYLLDGMKVTDELFNNLVINPSVDSIQEFKIQKSQYPAEFGGKASALINVATRAGTNAVHGSLFEFFRDEMFDAKNYFDQRDQTTPPLRQDQFGGVVGGPLARDRSFFFVSYEQQRVRRSLTRTFSVPPQAVRNGDFSSIGDVCDPVRINPGTGLCAPFDGRRIPATRLDPIAVAFLQRLPQPTSNAAIQNLTSIGQQIKDIHQGSVRLDHRFASGDHLFARFSTFDADEFQPFGSSSLQETLVPGFGRSVTTTTRNLGLSHTHIIGRSVVNELRFGWMGVKGGQVSENRGADFAERAGLQGVTTNPLDRGFPQISTRGLYSTFGDPTSFVYRNNRHIELYENVAFDRGAHRIKAGAYYFGLRLQPEQPDNARGAFTYTGQFSGNAFADFLLGYPTSAVVGVGRGNEDGRTHWIHAFVQDDWRVRSNLTLNAGLRYEYNQHLRDADNRLSSVDYETPGARFVIASDGSGRINPDAQGLLSQIPIPYVTSEEAGWDRGLLSPSWVRLAPRTGFAWSLLDDRAVIRGGYGIFLNQWAYSVQTAFAQNLPFYFTKQIDVPADRRVPAFQTANMLASDPTGVISPRIMDHDYAVEYTQTWSGGLQYELLPATLLEVSYMGSWTLGADNATVRNVPEPGPGSIQARRPIPQLGAIRSIRFDGRSIYHGVTFKAERRLRGQYGYNVSYTLSTSKDDASSPGATDAEANVPQNVRNVFSDTGEWALSSFDHRHLLVASGTYQFPLLRGSGALTEMLLGGWRVNAILSAQSGAPFTVNLGVDQANIGAGPAQRPDQLRDPNLPAGKRRPERWFDTSAFALQAPFTFGSAPRNSVSGPGLTNVDLVVAKTWALKESRQIEFRWEIFNVLNAANFDLPNRVFGTPNFGRIFSAKDPRQMQFGLRVGF
ncbi:MAG: TonB-dependent receptor [Acidobacteria bacterium]|nr:TonB-dependent receptor [Acidobacteriota bacterium]